MACNETHVHVHVHGPDHTAQLDRMEQLIMNEVEALEQARAELADTAADVRAMRDLLIAERDNLSEAGQAKLAEIKVIRDDLDNEIGDADGSDTPPPPAEEPGEGETPA